MSASVAGMATSMRRANRPVAFFANGLGDTILALPALRALSSIFAGRLILVCDLDIPSILFRDLPVRFVETRMTRNAPDWTREFSVGGVVAACGEPDLFISLVPWYSDSLRELLAAFQPVCSLGFFDDFSITLPLDFRKHAADLSFDLPRAIDPRLTLEEFSWPPAIAREEIAYARSMRNAIGASYRILVVHADTGEEKMWMADRFVRVLDWFLERHPEFFVLLVGGEAQPLDRGAFGHRVAPGYGLSLGVAFSLVGLADIFLGIDSCMLHAADFFRVPSIGLFGKSDPVQYGFRLTPHGIIRRGNGMGAIEVADVLSALESIETMSRGYQRPRL